MSLPIPSSELIKELDLAAHPEGGYYKQTDVQDAKLVSPFAGAERQLATSIYYLLSHDRPLGVFHMNKSVTYHVLHQGRAEYTLITPGNPPTIEKKVMGTDEAAGESRLLVVGTGIWKRSSLLAEDLVKATTEEDKERTNCLITEVVVPGFHWDDHVYMNANTLNKLFAGVEGGEKYIEEYSKFLGSDKGGTYHEI